MEHQQQQLGIELKPVEEQQVMEQFPLNGEEQPSSVLQLATGDGAVPIKWRRTT